MVAAATMVVVLMVAAAIKPRKRLGRKEGASRAQSRVQRGCRVGFGEGAKLGSDGAESGCGEARAGATRRERETP